ncbi:hypothetical protein Pint_18125 [Pistacia integerrima]|uniref:Uncharacterized protein n=1 Tax=Pistacia integerrima TaxID=434235 RepID=A0ACC0YTI6_9ROSI|nr:hypothetical protein Pint_18125 [Pistacia integerrima]
MAALSSINFIAPNLSQLVSAKLDETNYLMWLSQIVPVIKSHDLMGFVDGSLPCPSQFLIDDQGKPTTTLNPEYILWNRKDQFVLGWINATLSDKVAPYVYGLNSARPAWLALANKFASPSRSCINHLKQLL